MALAYVGSACDRERRESVYREYSYLLRCDGEVPFLLHPNGVECRVDFRREFLVQLAEGITVTLRRIAKVLTRLSRLGFCRSSDT